MKKMDTTYEIRNDYIFVKLMGNFDVNHLKEKIIEVNEKLLEHNLDKFFLDITEVTGIDETIVFSIYTLSSLIYKSFPIETKMSVLETKEQFRGHSFLEDVLTDKGFRIKVTTKLEECLKFLGVS
ncbi:MAG: hypothetical protein ACLQBQ_03730 [Smithella sp.]